MQRELAGMIAYELKDPRLDFVSVTQVVVTNDLRYARIYVSHLGNSESSQEIMSALDHASGFLRYQLSQRIQLRYMPELTFHYDEGLAASQRINALLDQLEASEASEDAGAEAGSADSG